MNTSHPDYLGPLDAFFSSERLVEPTLVVEVKFEVFCHLLSNKPIDLSFACPPLPPLEYVSMVLRFSRGPLPTLFVDNNPRDSNIQAQS